MFQALLPHIIFCQRDHNFQCRTLRDLLFRHSANTKAPSLKAFFNFISREIYPAYVVFLLLSTAPSVSIELSIYHLFPPNPGGIEQLLNLFQFTTEIFVKKFILYTLLFILHVEKHVQKAGCGHEQCIATQHFFHTTHLGFVIHLFAGNRVHF